mmetsp:Transcript_24749/g.68885  ORF Transcript_24749/g.68885 Transcript_24749/m.68885 type:complete len:219 (-) Transcript_24749:233-889(-)
MSLAAAFGCPFICSSAFVRSLIRPSAFFSHHWLPSSDPQHPQLHHCAWLDDESIRFSPTQNRLEVLVRSQTSDALELVGCNDGVHGALNFGLRFLQHLQVIHVARQLRTKSGRVGPKPLAVQGIFCRDSAFRIDREHGPDQVLGIARHVTPVLLVELVLSVTDHAHHLLTFASEGAVTTQHDIDDHSDTPHVAWHIVGWTMGDDLWCHVSLRTALRAQ